MRVFPFFENLLEPTALPPGPPPDGLGAFYWHHARQARALVAALFAAGLVVALLDTTVPVFVGRVVTMVSTRTPHSVLHEFWHLLLGMALVLLVARPLAMGLQNLITNQAIVPGFSNLIRWQSHWHVVRQSWTFFQNDYAGRIANRVMQTGPALRESVVSATNAVWYILVYGGGAIALLGIERRAAGGPGSTVVLRLCGFAALVRAAAAQPFATHVGDALCVIRAGRRQLHQHSDGQALCPPARRGRLRLRRDGRPDRSAPLSAAADDDCSASASRRSMRRWSSAPVVRRSGCGATGASPSG